MTSVEIADLVESRHDTVKDSIKRLANRGAIHSPAMADIPYVDESGRNRNTKGYVFTGDQGKRDSTIVVAQLSPEFTARLVDRWLELEEQAKQAAKAQLPDFITRGYVRVVEKILPYTGKPYPQMFFTAKGFQWAQRRLDHSLFGIQI